MVKLTAVYESDVDEEHTVDVVDAEMLAKFDQPRKWPWCDAVMFAVAYDIIMGEADPGELQVLFSNRDMGVVVYYDAEVSAIVTVYVEET